MKETESQKSYYTSDLYLAALLYAHHHELLKIEHEGRRAVFIFSGPDMCKKMALEFYRGNVTVDARAYIRGLQELKAAIFNL